MNIAKPLTVSRMTVTNMPTLSMGDYVLVFVERGSNACLLTALPGSQLMAQVSIIPATTEVASMETESQTQDCVIAWPSGHLQKGKGLSLSWAVELNEILLHACSQILNRKKVLVVTPLLVALLTRSLKSGFFSKYLSRITLNVWIVLG